MLAGADTTPDPNLGSGVGKFNSFFGASAGSDNTTGTINSFFGTFAGTSNTTGSQNAFFGVASGEGNVTGSRITLIGANSNVMLFPSLTNATAVGANATVTQSDSLVLGSINGVNGATASTNVGIGTTAPKARLEVQNGNLLIGSPGQGLILKSPDGNTCKMLIIDNGGNLVVSAVSCP